MKCRGVVLMIHLEKHKERRQNIENFLAVLGVAGLHHVEWVSLGLKRKKRKVCEAKKLGFCLVCR